MKDLEYFRKYRETHREQLAENARRYRERNPHVSKNYQRALKQRLIDGYGGACTCCGETAFEFLTLEHVNGDGKKHRREKFTRRVYLDVIDSGFSADYTILCMNCNFAKGKYGYCPHNRGV